MGLTDTVDQNGNQKHFDDGKNRVVIYNPETGEFEVLKDTNGDNMTVNQYNELIATIYAETLGSTESENGGIMNVILNRATYSKRTIMDIIRNTGIYGNSSTTQNQVFSRLQGISNAWISWCKIRNIRKGIANAISGGSDYSGGAYFWEGRQYLNAKNYPNNFFTLNGWGKNKGTITGTITFNVTVTRGGTVFMQYNSATVGSLIWP